MSEAKSKIPVSQRLIILLVVLPPIFLILFEVFYRWRLKIDPASLRPFNNLIFKMDPILIAYGADRFVFLSHPYLYSTLVIIFIVLFFFCIRNAVSWFYNKFLPGLMGINTNAFTYGFKFFEYSLKPYSRCKLKHCLGWICEEWTDREDKRLSRKYHFKENTFVGLDPKRKAIFLTEAQRSRHLEIIGRSGSGKTYSVILPMIFQDMCENKSVICIDGKGSLPFAEAIYSSLVMKHYVEGKGLMGKPNSSPETAIRVFTESPAFYYINPLQPEKSNTYNPLYTDDKTDLAILAEKVYRALKIEHEHWGTLARDILEGLIRVMHATGKQFNLRDIYVCLESKEARQYLYNQSRDEVAVRLLKFAFKNARKSKEDPFLQLKAKLKQLNNPLFNDYNPDIIPGELIESSAVLCASLASTNETINYTLGNMLLQDFKVALTKRFYRENQESRPCAIFMDEIQTFLNPELILSALAQFREANCQITISHQSGQDFRVDSPHVADAIWDNAQMKIILQTNDPVTCQKVADMLGTKRGVSKTFRTRRGPFFTMIPAFEESNRETDEYESHPNIFKKLRPRGQGYLISSRQLENPSPIWRLLKSLKGFFYHRRISENTDAEAFWQATPLNFAPFPDAFRKPLPIPEKRIRPKLEGLNLYEKFIELTPSKKPSDNTEPQFDTEEEEE